MDKQRIIDEILSLPRREQLEILSTLEARLRPHSLSHEQERELDRRLDRIEREGSKGKHWEKIYREMKRRYGGEGST